MSMKEIRIGDSFGRLMVVQAEHWSRIECKCSCGGVHVARAGNLLSGKTKSCGCIRKEKNNHVTHGGTGSLTHTRWLVMRRRCSDANSVGYENYGGRGIRVCERWSDFSAFLADMGECPPGMTIDRVDPNGNYDPGNCRWATKLTQARNTRANRVLEFNGQTKCLEEWAEQYGMNSRSLMSRLRLGWSVEKALTTPIRQHKQYKDRE
jgi:hypothetical protein